MKLTSSQLRRIIKEEITKVMKEHSEYPPEMDDVSREMNEPCPECGGENTTSEEMPSMMGYGEDSSLYCADCDRSFSVDPFKGGYNR